MKTRTSLLTLTSVFAIVLGISSLALALPHHQEGHVTGSDKKSNIGTNLTNSAEADVDFNHVRFDPESQKYLTIGSTEHCKENMRFFAVPNDNRLGQCDCDYYQCSRPMLYSRKTESCHMAWSRGPCEEGEWYTFTENLKPICEKNSCPESLATSTSNYYFKNPKDGKCYETLTKGYCEGDALLIIYPFEPIPACRTSTICYALTQPDQQLCVQGNRRHVEGLCESEFS